MDFFEFENWSQKVKYGKNMGNEFISPARASERAMKPMQIIGAPAVVVALNLYEPSNSASHLLSIAVFRMKKSWKLGELLKI